jgi:4-hydroxybenzoate polyprenyltransferase
MKWSVYLSLGRVSNLPTVWTNVLAGVILQGGEPRPGLILPLGAALSLIYVAGMFLNDAFDREVDARERPERPIPSGLAKPTEVFGAGYAMLGGALLILAATGLGAEGGPAWSPAGSGLALAVLVVYYDARHKGNPVAPVVMGLCRVMVYLTAALAAGGPLEPRVLAGAVVLLSYLIGVTGIARQETLSDLRHVWPLAPLTAPLLYGLPAAVRGLWSLAGGSGTSAGAAGAGLAPALLFIGLVGWVLYAVSFLVAKDHRDIPRAVVSLLAGICLLDGLLMAACGAASAAGTCVLGFGLTLFLQRFVKGT